METALATEGLRYVFMGDVLGGWPKNTAFYVDGKVSYALLSQSGAYREGIERLKTAVAKEVPAAVM